MSHPFVLTYLQKEDKESEGMITGGSGTSLRGGLRTRRVRSARGVLCVMHACVRMCNVCVLCECVCVCCVRVYVCVCCVRVYVCVGYVCVCVHVNSTYYKHVPCIQFQ